MKDYIQKFCEICDTRGFDKPKYFNGFIYATNGKIAIRVREDSESENDKNGEFDIVGAIEKLLKKESEKEYIPLDIELPARVKCDDCKGTGEITQCPKCNGTGTVECPTCGHDMECEHCDGDGYGSPSDETIMCKKCNGTGEKSFPVAIGKTYFDRKYLALLQSLPGPVEIGIDPDPFETALFRYPEGSGAIMPMKPY
jgi:RecJ-like exonuclease